MSTFAITDSAKVAAMIVGQDLNLAQHMRLDLAANYAAGKGSTVDVRVGDAVVARTKAASDKTTQLVADEIAEQTIPVKLETLAYNKTVLSVQDTTLNLRDFSTQVLAPQSRAIVTHIEREAAAAIQATPANASITYDPADPAKLVTAMRRVLRGNGVPAEATIKVAVGADVYADLLDAAAFDDSGKVRGLEVIESTRLAPTEAAAFIPSAFAVVVRAPAVPAGATAAASVKVDGWALTQIRDFDPGVGAEVSIVESLVKVAPMPLAVDAEDGTVTLVAHGGAVRVDTAPAL